MHPIRRLIRFSRKYWKHSIAALLCILSIEAINLSFPQIIKHMIDYGLEGKHYEIVPTFALLYLGLEIFKGFIVFSRGYLLNYISQRTCYDIRNRLFDHIQRLSFSYHDEAETGQLISRSTADVEALHGFLSEGVHHLVTNTIVVTGILIVCLHMNWQLALISLSMMPLLAASVFKYSRVMGPLLASVQDQFGVMTAAIQQNLMGIRVVKSFAREEYEKQQFNKQARGLMERNLLAANTSAFYAPMLDFIAAISAAFILWYGGMQVIRGDLSVGELVAFLAYVAWFVWPVRIMGYVATVTKNAVVSSQRIFEVLDTHAETHLKDGYIDMTDCKGHVEFKNVSFHYSDGSRALSNIELDVQPGEMVALVGATGSGKSSIINLLPRFYDVSEGAVLIDNIDVRLYKLESLRRHIGIVSQETFLFSDTVYGNIAYGMPGASLDEVIEAAKVANIHDFIMTLPEHYNTEIGERGVNLSGGQKQRIAIARALLMNPPILILDDATSSVDTETEALIQKALVSLTESRTTFVIAQRGSTIKRAHKIVVLDKGRVVDIGTHGELMAKDGLYKELFQLQFGVHEMEVGNAATGL